MTESLDLSIIDKFKEEYRKLPEIIPYEYWLSLLDEYHQITPEFTKHFSSISKSDAKELKTKLIHAYPDLAQYDLGDSQTDIEYFIMTATTRIRWHKDMKKQIKMMQEQLSKMAIYKGIDY